MSLHEGAKSRDIVNSKYLEVFEVKVEYVQRICVITFSVCIYGRFFTELARDSVLSELLYACDLFLMNNTIDRCRKYSKNKKFLRAKDGKLRMQKAE